MYIGEKDYFIQGILKTTPPTLDIVLHDIDSCYHEYTIPKADGIRTIQAIEKDSLLYQLQKNLCRYFLYNVSLPTPAIGFVRGESYVRFLSPHVKKNFYLRLDIKDFFGSISSRLIKKCFKEFFSDSDKEMVDSFVSLCTYNGHLPQGAITSPAISNIIFRRADQRILKYCQSFDAKYNNGQKYDEDICYTRYADDLLFSSNYTDFSKDSYFSGMISSILKDFGFKINKSKVKHGKGQISLSGYVISENIHLSRNKLGELNKLLYFFGKTDQYSNKKYRIKKSIFDNKDWIAQVNTLSLVGRHGTRKVFQTPQELLDYLCGYRSFLISILHANQEFDSSMAQLIKKISKLELIVDSILLHS